MKAFRLRQWLVVPTVAALVAASGATLRLAAEAAGRAGPPPVVADDGPPAAATTTAPSPPPPAGPTGTGTPVVPAVPPGPRSATAAAPAGSPPPGPATTGPFSPWRAPPAGPPSSPGPGTTRSTVAARPGAPAPPKGPGTDGSITPPQPQQGSMDELLQRDEPPPDGVAAQMDFFLGGSQDCVPGPGPTVEQVRIREAVTIPSAPAFCVFGFRPALPVTVTITTPAGSTHTRILSPDPAGSATSLLPVPPGSPEGRYLVDARQENGHAGTAFVARRTDRPTMAVAPLRVAPGTPIEVFLGGLPPGLRTDLHLYACQFTPAGTHSYRGTHTVTTDAAGDAHLVLHTSRATPDNCYIVQSQDVRHQKSGDRIFIPFGVYSNH